MGLVGDMMMSVAVTVCKGDRWALVQTSPAEIRPLAQQ